MPSNDERAELLQTLVDRLLEKEREELAERVRAWIAAIESESIEAARKPPAP